MKTVGFKLCGTGSISYSEVNISPKISVPAFKLSKPVVTYSRPVVWIKFSAPEVEQYKH